MYKVKCANPKCDKGANGEPAEVYAYAISKSGEVPPQYCCDFCRGEVKYEKKFVR